MFREINLSLRRLRREAGFSLLAILILALGIGATGALFSLVYQVLLEPLPYADPDRLVVLEETNPQKGIPSFSVSEGNFVSWRERAKTFESMAALRAGNLRLTRDGRTESVHSLSVTPSLFSVLKIKPVVGRLLMEDDARGEIPQVLLLSYDFWQRRFQGDPKVVGERMQFEEQLFGEVVGVLPPELSAPFNGDVIVPMHVRAGAAGREYHSIDVVGRLAEGKTVSEAQAELGAIARGLEQEYPNSNLGWGVKLSGLLDFMVGPIARTGLWALLAAVLALLAIATINLANLLLARAPSREREIGIRLAMGAPKASIVRALVQESVLLSTAGGVLGLLAAQWILTSIKAWIPLDVPRAAEASLNPAVILACLAVALVSGISFGCVPAFALLRRSHAASLRQSGSATTPQSQGIRHILSVAEIALSLALLLAAGLLFESFRNLQDVPLGYNPDGVFTAALSVSGDRHDTVERWANYFGTVVGEAEQIPGVVAAGVVNQAPLAEANSQMEVGVFQGDGDTSRKTQVYWRAVAGHYFEALRIPLLAGRYLNARDDASAACAVVLSRGTAATLWPVSNDRGFDPNALGRRITWGGPKGCTVVGVVEDTRSVDLRNERELTYYSALAQSPWVMGNQTMVLRAERSSELILPSLRAAVARVDAMQVLYAVGTVGSALERRFAIPRLQAVLAGAYAIFAFILATLGIYGVMAYAVNARRREIGVRMALGATGQRIARQFLSWGLRIAGMGLALGILLGAGFAMVIRSVLYGVAAHDPWTYAAATLALLLGALGASWIPARRASRANPVSALRHE